MNPPIEFYFWATPIVLAALIALVYAGKHLVLGRFVGDKPAVCRRCKYDLAGLESSVCPECGRVLGTRRAIRKGRRVRSPIRVTAGFAVAAMILGSGVMFEGFLRHTLNRELEFAPSLWLVRVANGDGHSSRRNNAAVLLMSRTRQGALSNGVLDGIAHGLLAESRRDLNGSSRSRLFADWDDYLDEAQTRGLITDHEYQSFLLDLVVLAVDPTVDADGSLEVTLALWSDTANNGNEAIPGIFRVIHLVTESDQEVAAGIHTTSHAMCCEVVSRAIVRVESPPQATTITLIVEMNALDPRTRDILDETWTVECVVFENGAPSYPSAHWRRGDPNQLSDDEAAMLIRPFSGVTY